MIRKRRGWERALGRVVQHVEYSTWARGSRVLPGDAWMHRPGLPMRARSTSGMARVLRGNEESGTLA